jgi:5-hydroxyisourate hydrolase-like protein (transthyretin family)
MKKNALILTLLLACVTLIPAGAQTYNTYWQNLKTAEQKSLPQTALAISKSIFTKAEAEKNSPQMLKAFVWRMNYLQRKAPDSVRVCLAELEQWTLRAQKPTDRAVLHTLMAQAYNRYVSAKSWNINQRTETEPGVVPDDMDEWGANLFKEKVNSHVEQALRDSALLLATSARSYVPFVEPGSTSALYGHNLYHLLVMCNVQVMKQVDRQLHAEFFQPKIRQLYANLIKAYKAEKNIDGVVLATLDCLGWHYTEVNGGIDEEQKTTEGFEKDAYMLALNGLLQQYGKSAVAAEIYLQQANRARSMNQMVKALALCNEGIARYPKYNRINALKEVRQEILASSLSFSLNEVVYPGAEVSVKVNHRNVDGFRLQFYKLNVPATSELLSERLDADFIKRHGTRVLTKDLVLKRTADYVEADTTLQVKMPAEGVYLITASHGSGVQDRSSLVYVSKLKTLTRRLPGQDCEVVVVDAQSGHPVADAQVLLYDWDKGDRKLVKTLTTDEQGKVVFPWDATFHFFRVSAAGDESMPYQHWQAGYYYQEVARYKEVVQLFTDRTIYRPGQTVYVKGVAYEQMEDSSRVVADKTYEVRLFGANGQRIDTRRLPTNEFGSFHLEFVLPASGLNGVYRLSVDDTECSFRVEEYKRPTFFVAFDEVKDEFQLNDSVGVRGTVCTYSAVPLMKAKVRYTVTRQAGGWWRMGRMQSEVIGSGETETAADGSFLVPVKLTPGKEDMPQGRYYRYAVEAAVTSDAGETQTETFDIRAGERSLVLSTTLKDAVCRDDSIWTTFEARNLSDKQVAVNGVYRLLRYTDVKADRVDSVAVSQGSFAANEKMFLADWQALPSGAYKLVLEARDAKGKEVTFSTKVVLFSLRDTRPAETTDLWYHPVNTEFDATHPAVFVVGTSHADAYVLMDVLYGDQKPESRVLHWSNSIETFRLPYLEKYGDGVNVQFCFVKNGQVYQQSVRLTKKQPEKWLKAKWQVFRDKLQPGKKEEWRLTLTTPQGKPAHAEMLATMYDASLDKIWDNEQEWNLYYNRLIPTVQWYSPYTDEVFGSLSFSRQTIKVPELFFDSLYGVANNEASHFAILSFVEEESSSIKVRGKAAGIMTKNSEELLDEVVVVGYGVSDEAQSKTDGNVQTVGSGQVRTNFAETAFFYPQLLTNEKGEVVFSFTMPESLTTWNFRGYAHTKDMLLAELDEEVVTSKDFMLTPNLPRFVRVGDHTVLAATVDNRTERALAGVVTLTWFNPLTNEVVATQKQPFATEAKQSVAVQFAFTATDRYDLLGCRLVAESENFSDGEQHVIPVLPNKEYVTEALPITVLPGKEQEYSLADLFNKGSQTATSRKLTVEFSSNPAWYAIQALPSVSNPESDNAISWATAYYANAMASYLVEQQPCIRQAMDAWKMMGGDKDTWVSNLLKNQELKDLLAEESPWLLEAQSETAQMERLATLFDLNNMNNKLAVAQQKLKALQLPDGSWSWYNGMSGSRYITTYVLETLLRLGRNQEVKLPAETEEMVVGALNYLHAEMLKVYQLEQEALKKGQTEPGITDGQTEYLYLVYLWGKGVPAANQKAYGYFLQKLSRSVAGLSLADKARAALVLHAAGKEKASAEALASLKEHTVYKPAEGRFFAFGSAPQTWNMRRMATQVVAIEAFETLSNDTVLTDEMKVWVLNQKRTQQWDSPVATVDAIYALLLRGKDVLTADASLNVKVGGKEWSVGSSVTNVMGYRKEVITDAATVKRAKNIRVSKQGKGLAWGGVYAQFNEEFGKITRYGTAGLSVDKVIYAERVADGKKQLQLITAANPLQVGDRVVVRLTIRLDRDMDFVQIKDRLAACMEPLNPVSGYRWSAGGGCYVEVKDASTQMFFSSMSKGVHVWENTYVVSRPGTYEAGIATVQGAYTPEYSAHSASTTLEVAN